jgi:hypothetical protein
MAARLERFGWDLLCSTSRLSGDNVLVSDHLLLRSLQPRSIEDLLNRSHPDRVAV